MRAFYSVVICLLVTVNYGMCMQCDNDTKKAVSDKPKSTLANLNVAIKIYDKTHMIDDEDDANSDETKIINKQITITGNREYRDRDFELWCFGSVIIKDNATLTLHNANLAGINAENLVFAGTKSVLVLENSSLYFDGNYTLNQGRIDCIGECKFVASKSLLQYLIPCLYSTPVFTLGSNASIMPKSNGSLKIEGIDVLQRQSQISLLSMDKNDRKKDCRKKN